MARGQGRHLVKEKQRGVALAQGLMVNVLIMEVTTYPEDAGPAALPQGLIITVEPATAVAHHEPTIRHRDDATVGLNAVLQGHGREPGLEPEW